MELPQKFCDEMKQLLEDEYPAYLSSMEEKRKYGLRVNTSKISVEKFLEICPFDVTPIPYINNGFYYEDKVQPAKHPYYFAGLYYLQDPSAMTPASRLPVEPGDTVLDLCAAPGGKATELAAKLKGKGLLVANDISSKRAKALLKNIELFGVENSFIVTEYPAKLKEYFKGFFDKILIDAPCSGEGMFRKDPSMIRAWEQNGPAFYSRLQREILEQALPMLKDGGMLLYSTCTFSVMEDEESVEYLLSLDGDLRLVEMEGYRGFAKGRPELAGGDPELTKCVRIFPHKLDGEGHFLALFQKGGEIKVERKSEGPMLAGAKRSGLGRGDRELFEAFSKNVVKEFDLCRIENKNGMLYYMPEMLPQLRGIRFLRSGLFLGEMKKKRFEPSQSLAMALRAEEYCKRAELTAEDERVLRYLKGETLTLEKADLTPEAQEGGWILVCVDGYPLGWGKFGGGVLKNKYHPGWRLM
ncbi:MAG: NOL1/NOP2/sun family putative RNA methylase [Eubacterium sp.]|nr:NOL1/NOP2/sun family putative RNA methylase [Eubacterium sp.]